MAAAQKDYTIEQGATFSRVLTYYDSSSNLVNLTGYTARMIAREVLGSSAIIFSLTTENGGITLGGAAGTITLFMSATTTGAIAAESGIYDFELISSGGVVTRLLQGDILIDKRVPNA